MALTALGSPFGPGAVADAVECKIHEVTELRIDERDPHPVAVREIDACFYPVNAQNGPTCERIRMLVPDLAPTDVALECKPGFVGIPVDVADVVSGMAREDLARGLEEQWWRVDALVRDAAVLSLAREQIAQLLGRGTRESDEEAGGAPAGTSDASDDETPTCRGFADGRPAYACCRVADSPEGEARWNVAIPQAYLLTLTRFPAAQLGAQSFGLGTVSLDIPDRGETSQSICYDPGEWSERFPETVRPEETTEVNHSSGIECGAGIGLILVGAAFVVAGSVGAFPSAGATATAIGAGLGMVGVGASMAAHGCGDHVKTITTLGWIRCEGQAFVTWGGHNAYDSRFLDLGLLSVEAASSGPGATPIPYPFTHQQQGYREGYAICEQKMEAQRENAWLAFQDWGATASGLRAGEAHIAATIPITDLYTGPAYDAPDSTPPESDGGGQLTGPNEFAVLGQGLFIPVFHDVENADASNWLVVGCDGSYCPTEIGIRASSCGQQTITPGAESVTYEFTGAENCAKLTINVGSQDTSVDVPAVRLNLQAGGVGGNLVT